MFMIEAAITWLYIIAGSTCKPVAVNVPVLCLRSRLLYLECATVQGVIRIWHVGSIDRPVGYHFARMGGRISIEK